MRRLEGHLVGVDAGSVVLFSDFEGGGEMWSGQGPREKRAPVAFAEAFRAPPSVFVALDMWDFDRAANLRADIRAEAVTATGFEIVFRTWGDTRIARARASWQAIGALAAGDGDGWDL